MEQYRLIVTITISDYLPCDKSFTHYGVSEDNPQWALSSQDTLQYPYSPGHPKLHWWTVSHFSDNVKGTIEVCIYSTTIDGDIQTSMLSLSWKWCWIFHPINPCPEQHIRNWTGYSCVIVTNLQFSISLERINQMPLTFPTWGGLPCLYCFHIEMSTKCAHQHLKTSPLSLWVIWDLNPEPPD